MFFFYLCICGMLQILICFSAPSTNFDPELANMKMQVYQSLSVSVANQPGHFSILQTYTIA
jgi:hypothetical protein